MAMLRSKKRSGKRRKPYTWNEILESKSFSFIFPAELALQRPSSCSLSDLSAVTFHCPQGYLFNILLNGKGKHATSKTLQNGGTSASVNTSRIYKLQKRVFYFQRPKVFIDCFLSVLWETGYYTAEENWMSEDFIDCCTCRQRESHY